MNRYQVYLNPESVGVVDEVMVEMGLSRSHLLRDVIDRVAREYEKVLAVRKKVAIKDNPLLKMAGMFKSKTGKVSENIDEVYFKD